MRVFLDITLCDQRKIQYKSYEIEIHIFYHTNLQLPIYLHQAGIYEFVFAKGVIWLVGWGGSIIVRRFSLYIAVFIQYLIFL